MAEGYGSYPTIREALNCQSNTEVARKIRQRALQLGGVVMEAEKVATVAAARTPQGCTKTKQEE